MWQVHGRGEYVTTHHLLHNDHRDGLVTHYTSRHKITYLMPPREQVFIQAALPYVAKDIVMQVPQELHKLSQSQCDGAFFNSIYSVKENKSVCAYRKYLYHWLRPTKAANTKLTFKRLLNTAWRQTHYKEFIIFSGRVLADPLKDQGWKYASGGVIIIGPEDWMLVCDESEYSKFVLFIYQHRLNPSIATPFSEVDFWRKKDAFRSKIKESV